MLIIGIYAQFWSDYQSWCFPVFESIRALLENSCFFETKQQEEKEKN